MLVQGRQVDGKRRKLLIITKMKMLKCLKRNEIQDEGIVGYLSLEVLCINRDKSLVNPFFHFLHGQRIKNLR